jgi:hypothetical protein
MSVAIIAENVEFGQYLKNEGVSCSRLKALDKAPVFASPGIYGVQDEEKDLSRDLVVGSATHAILWEPGAFEKRYIKLPVMNCRTKEGREEKDWYFAQYGEEFCLKVEEYELVCHLRDSLWKNEDAKFYLENVTKSEISVFWTDDRGIQKKARPDAWLEAGAIFDLKTCQDASPRGFKRMVVERRYDLQAAMYLEGMRAAGKAVEHFAFLAVEKSFPYAVGIYQLSDDRLKRATEDLARLSSEYKACLDSGTWPSYGQAVLL